MSVTAIAAAAAAVINANLLPDVCEIQTVTLTSDSAGGATESWATVASVKCQVSDLSAQARIIADKLTEAVDKQITLAAGTTVTGTQRIKSTKGATVTYYRVVGVNDRSFELARSLFAQTVRP